MYIPDARHFYAPIISPPGKHVPKEDPCEPTSFQRNEETQGNRKAIVTVSARSQLDLCDDRITSSARSVVSAEGPISLMDNSYNPATLVQAPD